MFVCIFVSGGGITNGLMVIVMAEVLVVVVLVVVEVAVGVAVATVLGIINVSLPKNFHLLVVVKLVVMVDVLIMMVFPPLWWG